MTIEIFVRVFMLGVVAELGILAIYAGRIAAALERHQEEP